MSKIAQSGSFRGREHQTVPKTIADTPRKNNIAQNPRISKISGCVSEPCFHDIRPMLGKKSREKTPNIDIAGSPKMIPKNGSMLKFRFFYLKVIF